MLDLSYVKGRRSTIIIVTSTALVLEFLFGFKLKLTESLTKAKLSRIIAISKSKKV